MADRKLTIALALFALVLVATDVAAQIQPNTWLFRDGRFYTNVNENILLEGSLEDPFAASWYQGNLGWNRDLTVDFSNLALGARGEHYHFRPWILPVASTPFYFAFGLLGVLLFSCALYAFVAAASFRFVRAYTTALPAALTAVAMVLASGFRHHVYNYSVDMLLVTAFLCGLWGLMEKKGWLAGALVASTVMIKPTVLLYAPALALVMWERNDGKTLLRAIGGGSVVLGIYGCINWYMFGRPWWTGYTRTLVTVNGEPDVYTNTASFETPLEEGARDLLTGPDGVVWWHGLFVLALPGLAVVLRRFPRSGIAILASSIAAYALFSKFQWHHDRFLFPTVALLALPLALGMQWAGGGVRRALLPVAPLSAAGTTVFAVAVVALIASAFTGGPLPTRQPDEGAIQGAIALGEGALDVRDASSDVTVQTLAPTPEGTTGSTTSLSATGAWLPRASLVALVPLAPLARMAGRHGVAFGGVLAMAGAVAALAWLLRRRLGAPLAAAIALGGLLVGPVRDAALGRPIEALTALLLFAGLARAATEESDDRAPFVTAAISVALAGVVSEQPLLGLMGVLAVIALARFRSRSLVVPTALAGLGAVISGALVSLVVWGGVLATAEGSVLAGPDGSIAEIAVPTLDHALSVLASGPSVSRAIVPLLLSAPLALAVLVRAGERRIAVALGAALAALMVPGVAMRHEVITPLAVLGLTAASGVVAQAVAVWASDRIAERGAGRVALALTVAVSVALLGAGLAHRAQARDERFWIGTPRSVREATVLLGDAPCDFLAWENMAWECAMLDGGAMGRVGLALPDMPRIDGRLVPGMLLIPTGLRRSDPRVVRWENVPAGRSLHLVVGAPDGEFTTAAQVVVRIDGTDVDAFSVVRDEGGLRDRLIDTSAFDGREVSLEIEMRGTRRGQQAAIVVAGGFSDAVVDAPAATP